MVDGLARKIASGRACLIVFDPGWHASAKEDAIYMHRRLSMHSDSWKAGSHGEGRGHQQTSEIHLTLERPATGSDCSGDTCSAPLTSKHGNVTGSVGKPDALFDFIRL